MRFTDTEKYFVSEASAYRLLKAHDLIASPAYIVIKAAEEFTDKTTAPNQLWQTDFTYLKVIDWRMAGPVHGPRWLLALYHCLKAVQDDAERRRHPATPRNRPSVRQAVIAPRWRSDPDC